MKRLMLVLVLSASVAALSASTAEAQEAPADGAQAQEEEGGGEATVSEEADPVEEDDGLPIGVSLSVSGNFGAASLLSESEFTQTDYFLLDTSGGITYSPIDELTLSTGLGFSKYLTEDGDGVRKREGRLSDWSFGASWAGWTEEYSKIKINAGANLWFPTSDASQFERRLLRSRAQVGINRKFGGLSLTYRIRASKYFHEFTSVVGSPDELDIIARDNGNENVGSSLVALDTGVLPEYGIDNQFIMAFGFLTRFNASVVLQYSDVWTYDNGTITADDEFTSPNAVVGRGHSQSVVGVLGLGASINDYLSADASMVTAGRPLSNDNQSVRFPFWDFENGQASRTSFSLGLTASY